MAGIPYGGFDTPGLRGRDTASRGLETPGGFPRTTGGSGSVNGARRSASAYENGGSGSISAPLSPHRLYAQLAMGKGPSGQSNWPTYDPRMHATPGLAVGASHRNPRSASNAPTPTSTVASHDNLSQLPVFAPFSPPNVNSTLKPLNGEMTFLSPSTLLSPAQGVAGLPSGEALGGVGSLAESFEKMGVSLPGQGAEVQGLIKERVEASDKPSVKPTS
jgi:terminal uridylyltransferase